MRQIFKVYTEAYVPVTVDVPDGATNADVAELINEEFYDNGAYINLETLSDEIIDIEDKNGNSLSKELLGIVTTVTSAGSRDEIQKRDKEIFKN